MEKMSGACKLRKIRELMEAVKVVGCGGQETRGIQALIVTLDDAHQSEYLAERDKRIKFLSGFSGSFGTVIVTPDKALLWTDGRYYTQALAELDPPSEWTLMRRGLLDTPLKSTWLVSNLPPKSTVGVDPNLISYTEWSSLFMSLVAAGHYLMPLKENLVDKIWDEDRGAPTSMILPHPYKFSGCKASEKVEKCREEMSANGTKILVVTALDEVAYLLNFRGSDIPYNPVFFAYVILTMQEVHIFVDVDRVSKEAQQQLIEEGVNAIYHPYEDIHTFLKQLAADCKEDEKIWISNNSSYALHSDCKVKHTALTPISLMKAIKNTVEIEGMRAAHVRDSVALVKYFAWLEDQIVNKRAHVTEITGATRLEQFRKEQENFVGLSFPTISSVGPNGAIIHYLPSPKTDLPITDKELYLCDSGAQYFDGTTDVTRTFHFGQPTEFERECFTRVFKGQCRLSSTIFPLKIQGNYLDTLARENLWSVGLNYLHGTGHGVGAYLNVHEGPIGISWRPYPGDPGLQPGMFVSNEPGYYEDGKFGIRLENVELIVKANTPHNYNDRGYLTFETVTLVPIQTKMLDVSLLTENEINYLNKYHERCLNTLKPFLEGPENALALEWLQRETQPITK